MRSRSVVGVTAWRRGEKRREEKEEEEEDLEKEEDEEVVALFVVLTSLTAAGFTPFMGSRHTVDRE